MVNSNKNEHRIKIITVSLLTFLNLDLLLIFITKRRQKRNATLVSYNTGEKLIYYFIIILTVVLYVGTYISFAFF